MGRAPIEGHKAIVQYSLFSPTVGHLVSNELETRALCLLGA